MATDNLSITRDCAKLDELASTVQIQASRIRSLAEAIDEAIDFCSASEGHNERLNRALDYLNLLREAAEKVRAAGEQVEIISIQSKGCGQ